MSGKEVSDFIEYEGFEYPKNPRAHVYIGNDERAYEFLGLFKLDKGFATPSTLGNRIKKFYQVLTDVQCLEFMNKYANNFWKDKQSPDTFPKAELASYPVVMSFVTDEDMFRKLKGNELLTNTIIERKNEKTTMNIDPIIDRSVVIISENEIGIEEDIEGWSAYSGKCLDPMCWSISEWKVKTSNSQTVDFPTCFHNPSKDSKVEKSIPRVFLAEDDTIHVFSDTPLDRKSYTTKFPLVRRLR